MLAGNGVEETLATNDEYTPTLAIIDKAPGNGAAIGGIRVGTASGWFAARPSGTEPIYKIYAESFEGPAQLRQILQEAQATVDAALARPARPARAGGSGPQHPAQGHRHDQ